MLVLFRSGYEAIAEVLKSDYFADAVHGRIYQAIGRLIDRGQIADPITLKDFFAQDEALQEVGGAQYIVQLAASVVSIINIKDYANTIRDLYRSDEHTYELQSLMRISYDVFCVIKQNHEVE